MEFNIGDRVTYPFVNGTAHGTVEAFPYIHLPRICLVRLDNGLATLCHAESLTLENTAL